MKTVTAKEFQLKQSQMMKEVAKGAVYQVTYHGKPWIELHPGTTDPIGKRVGSPEAFKESLSVTLSSSGLPASPDYKSLRRQQLVKKFGA